MTEDIKAFCDYLKKQVADHSLYLWGGQGEPVEENGLVNMRYICRKEQNQNRAEQVAAKIVDCYFHSYYMSEAKFFDCSGLGTAYFMGKGYIKDDLTADGLYKMCEVHPDLSEVRPGDMVFKNKTTSGWGHVGYVSGTSATGETLVTEARGRAYGVVTRTLANGEWKATGRPGFWSGEAPAPEFVRNLYYRKGNLMRGDDVRAVQVRLTELNIETGEIDGVFGLKTKEAVIDYQIIAGLTVDGIVGRNTWDALFGED